MMKRKQAWAGVLVGILALRGMAAEVEVELPPSVIGEQTEAVLWADARLLSHGEVKLLGNSAADFAKAENRDKLLRQFQMWDEGVRGFLAAGGEVFMVTSTQPITTNMTVGVQVKAKGAFLARLRTGTAPADFQRDLNALMDKLRKEYPELMTDPALTAVTVTPASGDWVYCVGKGLHEPLKITGARFTVPFTEALNEQTGSAIRVGFVNTPAMRTLEGSEAQLHKDSPFASLILNLRMAKSISVGLWPRANSQMATTITFPTAIGASNYKQIMDGMVGQAEQMMGMAQMMGVESDDQMKMHEMLLTAIAPVLLTQDGALLKSTVRAGQARKIWLLSQGMDPGTQRGRRR